MILQQYKCILVFRVSEFLTTFFFFFYTIYLLSIDFYTHQNARMPQRTNNISLTRNNTPTDMQQKPLDRLQQSILSAQTSTVWENVWRFSFLCPGEINRDRSNGSSQTRCYLNYGRIMITVAFECFNKYWPSASIWWSKEIFENTGGIHTTQFDWKKSSFSNHSRVIIIVLIIIIYY